MKMIYQKKRMASDRILDILKMYFSVDYEQTCILPDYLFLKIKYKKLTGTKLNLRNPKLFNEKLQWLKIHNRDPLYTKLVDKYEVKDIVGKKIGAEYIIPTYGVWERFEDIDFNQLPQKFVLKTTHDSGGVYIVDKENVDYENAKNFFYTHLKRDYYKHGREWPYKNCKHRIIAEKYVTTDGLNDVIDYKFYCFNGKPEILLVVTDRSTDCRFDFYDMEFNHLDIVKKHPWTERPIKKPLRFDEMKGIAQILSTGVKFVRIDLYEIGGKIYFGEYTFFPSNGFSLLNPRQWEIKLGNLIKI